MATAAAVPDMDGGLPTGDSKRPDLDRSEDVSVSDPSPMMVAPSLT